MCAASTLSRRYLDDITLPGTAHMAFVRSPHAHARVSVRSAPGVWTAAEIAGRVTPAPVVAPPALSVEELPHPSLATNEVHYVGQPVAVVVADSRALAEDAAERVEVTYEPLEPVDDPRAGETLMRWEKREGDVPAAFRAAAHVVRTEHVIPRVVAAPLEPRGALAAADGDRLTVWTSSQSAHRPRAQLAQALGRDEASIRVVVPDVGGAFGSKGTLPVETPLVALAALDLGRPVRWTEDRNENVLSATQGRGMRAAVELALDADGRILALRARLLADVGAYLLPSTPFPAHATAMSLTGAYDIPAVEVFVTGARTHKVPAGPFRGSEASALIETTIDAAARELRIDPVQLRRRNLVREFPYRTALGWTYDSGDFERCLDRAVELIAPPKAAPARTDWSAPPAALEPEEPRDVLVGTGVALAVHRSGGLYEYAEVHRDEDGVLVLVGSGPGYETLFTQIVADRLGIAPERVTVRTGDTDELADGVGSHASRTTAMGGSAVVAAIDDLNGGTVGRGRFESEQVFGSGAYAAVVEVDRGTGAVRVRRFVAVDDAGRIINPRLAEGQVVGGTVLGLGTCLPVTAVDVPAITTAFVESPSPLNPLGAKGISDGAASGAPAAVANALADAIGRHLDPPFTAEKVWQALQ